MNTGSLAAAADDNPLDTLRNTIELEKRFKSTFLGYDKRSVLDYIEQLTTASERNLLQQQSELNELKEKYSDLLYKVENQEKLIAEARNEERCRLEGAVQLKESMLEGLRSANQRLTDENHRLQVDIADAQQKMAEMEASYTEGKVSLSAVNDQLAQMLADKFSECAGIISNWKAETERQLS